MRGGFNKYNPLNNKVFLVFIDLYIFELKPGLVKSYNLVGWKMKEIIQRIIAYSQKQYITVLLALAIVSGINYLVLIDKLKEQEGSVVILKMNTDQSHIVQAISLLTTEIPFADKKQYIKIRSQIIKQKTLLKDTHQILKSGDRFLRKDGRLYRVFSMLPDELQDLYFDKPFELEVHMRSYLSVLNKITKMDYGKLRRQSPELQNLIYTITPNLLVALNRVSTFHQKRSEYVVGQSVNIQNLTFVLSILALVAVGSLLLKPLVENLEQTTLRAKTFADNIINTAETLIIGIDSQQNIVLFNSYAEELSGWGAEELRDQNFFQRLIPEQDQVLFKPIFKDMMQGEVEFADEIETHMQVQTGELINIVWHTTVVKSQKNQEPVMFLATGLDITDRKLAEQKVQDAYIEMEKLTLRLKSEVDLAATLQQSILPDANIDLPGFMGKANLLTSSEVGGDYYDYYEVGRTESVILVGDVSGHGVAAGTMVSAAKAAVYPLVHDGISSPAEILHSLNETMLATAQQSLLMTMACISLDASTGKLRFANAGHVLPYLWRNQEQQWEILEASGLPLGKSVDADYRTTAIELNMEVGDRLFLFTDAMVEEESPSGEAFGYDRLENLLHECGEVDPDMFRDIMMEELIQHCGSQDFEDDITILVVNHSDRVEKTASSAAAETSDIIRLTEAFYRQGERPVPRIPREFIVFIAEKEYADLLPRLSQDGLCRILPRHDDFCQQIGWDHLLNQHHQTPDDDLYALLPNSAIQRQFQLTHTEDKGFVMEEIHSWLSDQNQISGDHVETLIVVLDEMIENSLYAAPRDGKGMPYYKKGVSRGLSEIDEVRIDLVLFENKLGLMITDNWGTLTPAVFLRRIANAMDGGVEAGVGGAGLYMMWRLSDYFQIRVYPQQRTQVTTLWDLNRQINMDTSSGFQFLHHSEVDALTQIGS